MIDWPAFTQWPSDLQRGGTISATLLLYFPRPRALTDRSRLFVESAACWYMVPEGQARKDEDREQMLRAQTALDGDEQAAAEVGYYYLRRARGGDTAEERVGYRAVLAGFMLSQNLAAPALQLCGEAFEQATEMPLPRRLELLALLWCLAMHGVRELPGTEAESVLLPLSMRLNMLQDALRKEHGAEQDSERRSLIWCTQQLTGILFGRVGVAIAEHYNQPAPEIAESMRGMARRLEERTAKRWPVESWVEDT